MNASWDQILPPIHLILIGTAYLSSRAQELESANRLSASAAGTPPRAVRHGPES